MVDLNRIVSVIQIERVRLREAQCRSAVQPSEIADEITVTTSRKTEVVQEPTADRASRIETAFKMEVRSVPVFRVVPADTDEAADDEDE